MSDEISGSSDILPGYHVILIVSLDLRCHLRSRGKYVGCSIAEKDVRTVLGADISLSAMDARATILGMNARLTNNLDHRYKYSKHYRVL